MFDEKDTWMAVTWESSDVRRWLNDDFLNTFNETDRARIVETTVINNNNPWDFSDSGGYASTPGGNDTTDRIFLLSIDDVLQYFGDSNLVALGATMGARERDAHGQGLRRWGIYDRYNNARISQDSTGSVLSWWLRSSGHNSRLAAVVGTRGYLIVDGDSIINSNVGIRLALWLSLES